ncbi:hypothetical protein B0H63DRAFT_255003 [Podospora didyma]|uniref:Uncharacterized protein n=1 Tax=Podospora didyma TaxID=330526 RepID=A0AAE0N8G2_9PEZI|nr:hypothetical protein B0H63DRAFT_255003 [Podospora didyma]
MSLFDSKNIPSNWAPNVSATSARDYEHKWPVDKWPVSAPIPAPRKWRNQEQQRQKPCAHGPNCIYLQTGTCFYYHSEKHVRYREEAIRTGLSTEPDTIECLNLGSLVADQNVSIEDVCDLASFNKLADGEIVVPGSPPRFEPLSQAVEIALDSRNRELGQGYPTYKHTFEPLLRSVEATLLGFNILDAASIVSNASNLRKLFHILLNQRRISERYDLEWRGNTLFLSKWVGDPSLQLSLGHGAGFEKETCRYDPDDHELLRRSASHHRVVQYRFAGLDLIVQSEVDGFKCDHYHPSSSTMTIPGLPRSLGHKKTSSMPGNSYKNANDLSWRRPSGPPALPASRLSTFSSISEFPLVSPPRSPPQQQQQQQQMPAGSPPMSPLRRNQQLAVGSPPNSRPRAKSFSFAALALDDPGDTPSYRAVATAAETATTAGASAHAAVSTMPVSPTLTTHRCGRNIPSSCLVEVKTHKASNIPMFAPEAQLYFSRRRLLYVAQHLGGVFSATGSAVQEIDLKAWQNREDVQVVLGKLAALLRLLRTRARELAAAGMDRVSLVCESDGMGRQGNVQARLYHRVKGASLLPPDQYLY